jgi:hypothetical protein
MYFVEGAALILVYFVLKLLYNYINIIVIAKALERGIMKGVSKFGKKVTGTMPGLRKNDGCKGPEDAPGEQNMHSDSKEQGKSTAATTSSEM